MNKNFLAKASITINNSIEEVWDALVNPETIRQYMFGAEVLADWKPGGSIVWKGLWKGREYEDRGVILRLEPYTLLEYTHFSPLSGFPDIPEHYHTVTYVLMENGPQTMVALTQGNNRSAEEKEHSEQMWESMLAGLKEFLESHPGLDRCS